MPDDLLIRDGPVAVPLNYQVPQSGELVPLMVRATVDGTAAASAFYAAVQIIAPSGRVMGTAISDSIAAGASADVTWFPRVGGTTVSGTSTLPINPALSGNVILPLSILLGTRAVQPAGASFVGNGHNHLGMRVTMTRTGTLHDLAIYVTTAAGSAEVAIIDTTTPTRNIVYKSGLVAVPTSHAWQVVADPALPVTVGDQYDFVYGNGSACSVMWMGGLVNTALEAASGQLPAGFMPVTGGAPPKITWADAVSPLPYAAQTTVAEANLTPQQNCPLIWARIA
jgi:hypothetical protein